MAKFACDHQFVNIFHPAGFIDDMDSWNTTTPNLLRRLYKVFPLFRDAKESTEPDKCSDKSETGHTWSSVASRCSRGGSRDALKMAAPWENKYGSSDIRRGTIAN